MADFLSKYTGEEINEGIRRALMFNQSIIAAIKLDSSVSTPYSLNELPDSGIYMIEYVTNAPVELAGIKPVYIQAYADSTKKYQLINMGNNAYIRSGVFPVAEELIVWGVWESIDYSGLTPAKIKERYENNANTNCFTDADKTKLGGVEAGATKYDDTAIQAEVDDLALSQATHSSANINTETGLHGIRYFNGILQVRSELEWIDCTGKNGKINLVPSSAEFPVDLKPLFTSLGVDAIGGKWNIDFIKDPIGKMNTYIPQYVSLVHKNGETDPTILVECGGYIYESTYNAASPIVWKLIFDPTKQQLKIIDSTDSDPVNAYTELVQSGIYVIDNLADKDIEMEESSPFFIKASVDGTKKDISTICNGSVFSITEKHEPLYLAGSFNATPESGITPTGLAVISNLNESTQNGIYDDVTNHLEANIPSDIKTVSGTALSSYVRAISFTSDGKYFIIGGTFTGYCKLYSFSNGVSTYISDIKADSAGTALSSPVYSTSFTSDNKYFIIGGVFAGYCKLYSFNNGVSTYISDIKADNIGTELSSSVLTLSFTSDDKYFILGGYFNGFCKLYSFSNGASTYISDIKADGAGTALNTSVYSLSFTFDGKYFIIGGDFTSRAKLYSFIDGVVTYISDIKADNIGTALSSTVFSISFTSDDKYFILGGFFTGICKLYSLSNGVVTYISDIKADAIGTALSSCMYSISFTSDNNYFMIGGFFTGFCKLYSFINGVSTYISDIKGNNEGTIRYLSFTSDNRYFILGGEFTSKCNLYSFNNGSSNYISNIYGDSISTALSSPVYSTSFTSDNKYFIIGGVFAGYCKLYSFNNGVSTYISDIYMNNTGAALNNTVRTISFTSDDKYFVIGGDFAGICKLYSFNNEVWTYISDIKADGIGTALNIEVSSISFTSDNKYFILGGDFTGKAKLYSFNNGVSTYISDIYGDGAGTVLNSYVRDISFTSDGKYFMIGGSFTGYCKLYSFSNGVVTYISDIKADSIGTVLDSYVRSLSFTSDDKYFILGGTFTGYCKLYSLSNGVVAYISDIYMDSIGTALNHYIYSVSFTSDDKHFIIGGEIVRYCKLYSFNNGVVTYISDIKGDGAGTALNGPVWSTSFTSDDKYFIIGGTFTTCCKLYSPDPTAQYVNNVYSVTFTDDNKYFIVCNTSKHVLFDTCKLYSFNNGVSTYISDIYKDNTGTPYNRVNTTAFSHDNKYFIIGSQFTIGGECLNLYSFNNGVVSHLKTIDGTSGFIGTLTTKIEFTADDKYVVITSDTTLHLFSIANNSLLLLDTISASIIVDSHNLCKFDLSKSNRYIAFDNKVYKFYNGVIDKVNPLQIASTGNVVAPIIPVETTPKFIGDNYIMYLETLSGKLHYYKLINNTLVGVESISIAGSGIRPVIDISTDSRFIIIPSTGDGDKVKLYKFSDGKITFIKDMSTYISSTFIAFLPVAYGDTYLGWTKTGGGVVIGTSSSSVSLPDNIVLFEVIGETDPIVITQL